MSNDTWNYHTPLVGANDIDAVVNAAYDFGSSQLLVRKFIFNYDHDLHIYSRGLAHLIHINADTIYFMQGEHDEC